MKLGLPTFKFIPPPPANKLVHINIKSGDMNFGQRIELGKIAAMDCSELEKFEKVFICLHKFKPTLKECSDLLDYFTEIIEGLKFWIDQEITLLKYKPSIEEKRAGVKELSEKIGEFGTIKALAKAYGKDPDEILLWKYGKVFGILFTDLEEHKFQVRYNKVIESKFKV